MFFSIEFVILNMKMSKKSIKSIVFKSKKDSNKGVFFYCHSPFYWLSLQDKIYNHQKRKFS